MYANNEGAPKEERKPFRMCIGHHRSFIQHTTIQLIVPLRMRNDIVGLWSHCCKTVLCAHRTKNAAENEHFFLELNVRFVVDFLCGQSNGKFSLLESNRWNGILFNNIIYYLILLLNSLILKQKTRVVWVLMDKL